MIETEWDTKVIIIFRGRIVAGKILPTLAVVHPLNMYDKESRQRTYRNIKFCLPKHQSEIDMHNMVEKLTQE